MSQTENKVAYWLDSNSSVVAKTQKRILQKNPGFTPPEEVKFLSMFFSVLFKSEYFKYNTFNELLLKLSQRDHGLLKENKLLNLFEMKKENANLIQEKNNNVTSEMSNKGKRVSWYVGKPKL